MLISLFPSMVGMKKWLRLLYISRLRPLLIHMDKKWSSTVVTPESTLRANILKSNNRNARTYMNREPPLIIIYESLQ